MVNDYSLAEGLKAGYLEMRYELLFEQVHALWYSPGIWKREVGRE